MIEFSLVIPAFIAGILTFLAPCTLPLVPGYLGFISGVSAQDLRDPGKAKSARRMIFLNGIFFIFGFSVVFIILGTAAGFFGHAVFQYRIWLSRIGGVFVILFGLFMLHPYTNPLVGVILDSAFFPVKNLLQKIRTLFGVGVNVLKIPFLSREIQLKTPAFFQRGKAVNSFLLGTAFGFGWTPCVGPILGSILALAAASATAAQGAFLLGVFSLGLAVPFLAIAAGFGSAAAYIARIGSYLRAVSIFGGSMLIILGVLLVTNNLGAWIAFFYRWLDVINYGALLDYL